MSTGPSGHHHHHHFVLASVSVGIAVALVLSLAALYSIVDDVSNMRTETMTEMDDFRGIADATWNSLTQDYSMFILGVRATRQSGYAQLSSGGYAGGAAAAGAGGGGYSSGAAAAAGGGGGGCNCAAKAAGCPAGPPGPPGEHGEAGGKYYDTL
ncbi:hypothetical protein PRIPAC_76981 [Pristionchus pacificus]|uniref:Col_cuticle_N domain-containing protein n=1 Tax=Pristionchus pacificus TaxID=54126 RepID=A0A2A6CM04_PRIPA|nr:hypothetical protein PRIPAC_76981 [Pristionchus pacificus]|eukprot:PDM79275.1 hypothetical protein PRIPAC_31854 [Pristionchus pacificus]